MSNVLAYPIITGFLLILLILTIIIGIKARKRIYKYIPAIAAAVTAVIICLIISLFNKSSYVALVYVFVLVMAAPGIAVSLFTALVFEITAMFKKSEIEKR